MAQSITSLKAGTNWQAILRLACELPHKYHNCPFHCELNPADDTIIVEFISSSGQRATLSEPWDKFPSKGLVAQLLLVL